MKIKRIAPGGSKLTSDTGIRPIDPGMASKSSRATAELGGTIQRVAQKFEDLYISQKTDEAKIATYKGVTDIESMAKTDPDIDNPETQSKYEDQIADLKDNVLSIMPEGVAKANYSNDFELESLKLRSSIKSFGRQSLMHKTIANKQEMFSIMQKEYVVSDPVLRPDMLNSVLGEINTLEKEGFMLPEKAQALSEQIIEQWETQAAIKDTEVYGADYAIEHIGDYNVEDKEKLTGEIKRVGLLRKKQFDLAVAAKYQEGQKEVFDMLDSPDMDYVAKLNTIQQKENWGDIDKKTSDIAKQNLNSANKIDARTQTSKMAEIVRLIDDLNIGVAPIKDKRSSEEVLSRIKDTKDLVIELNTRGELTNSDKTKLLADIDKKTSEEQRKSAQELMVSGSPWHWGYNDADQYFKDNLVNDAYRNEAIREFFYAIEGRKVNSDERKKIADNIAVKIKNDSLGVVSEALAVGTEQDGYKFKGGDRYDKKNWGKI